MTLFTAPLEAQLSQGDVFSPYWDNDRAPNSLGPVIVISWGSEIDKDETIHVADTTAEADTEPGLLANMQGGRVWHAAYFLEIHRWVNLRTIRPVARNLFADDRLDRRIHSMTLGGRLVLAGRIFSFLTRTLPPRRRYFRDGNGVVWDAWEVRRKDIDQFEGRYAQRVAAPLANGWLSMVSPVETRRVAPLPIGWQHLPDADLSALVQQSPLADPADVAAMAIDQTARINP
jgi:hypothetical protein